MKAASKWVTVPVGILFVLIIASGGTALAAEHYAWPRVILDWGIVVFVAGYFLLPTVWFASKEPVLYVGILPSGVAWTAIALPAATITRFGEVAGISLIGFVLLALWVVPICVWVLLTWWIFSLSRRKKDRRVWGALLELLALSLLVAPWMFVAFVLPPTIGVTDDTITIVASIGIGLLWGKVLSEPFAQLIQEIRELCHAEDKIPDQS